MNLILLHPEDFIVLDIERAEAPPPLSGRALLRGRRLRHVLEVHRAVPGDELCVGLLDGSLGRGRVLRLDGEALELEVTLEAQPPARLPWTLILALPRPKVLNRILASATSLGFGRIVLVNAWKVEKAYWKSPRMEAENLLEQRILGLEQARDTRLPELSLERLFRPFAQDRLPALAQGACALVAHPGAPLPCPRALQGPLCLAVGPEGGWIDAELRSFQEAGFQGVDLGPRILRVETALAALAGRLAP